VEAIGIARLSDSIKLISRISNSCEPVSPRLILKFIFVSLIIAAVTASTGCGGSTAGAAEIDPVPLSNAPNPLATPTYDGSGQSVEPDVVFVQSGWHGFTYWMAFSPYPNGNERDENPSILASNDGTDWGLPTGLVNPLALPSTRDKELADASIFYDADSNQLWVYYIDVFATTMSLLRLTSSDGITWQNGGVLFTVPDQEILSPTVAKVGSYKMWVVNGGSQGCYTTSPLTVDYRSSPDGVRWSDPQATDMAQTGYSIWHINVVWIPSKQEYWAAVSAFPSGLNCDSTVLFFSTSMDGLHWTSYQKIALDKGASWDRDQIYRSVFLYDPAKDQISLWYSARGGQQWHIGFTKGNYDEFQAWLTQ